MHAPYGGNVRLNWNLARTVPAVLAVTVAGEEPGQDVVDAPGLTQRYAICVPAVNVIACVCVPCVILGLVPKPTTHASSLVRTTGLVNGSQFGIGPLDEFIVM